MHQLLDLLMLFSQLYIAKAKKTCSTTFYFYLVVHFYWPHGMQQNDRKRDS